MKQSELRRYAESLTYPQLFQLTRDLFEVLTAKQKRDLTRFEEILRPYGRYPHEVVVVLFLDEAKNIICYKEMFAGDSHRVILTPQEIIREAVVENATFIIPAHNHPVGHPYMSSSDIYVLQRLVAAAELVGLVVPDAFIITPKGLYSMCESGYGHVIESAQISAREFRLLPWQLRRARMSNDPAVMTPEPNDPHDEPNDPRESNDPKDPWWGKDKLSTYFIKSGLATETAADVLHSETQKPKRFTAPRPKFLQWGARREGWLTLGKRRQPRRRKHEQ